MRITKILAILATLMSFNVHAIGFVKGNGGDAVVCRAPLGYYEETYLLESWEVIWGVAPVSRTDFTTPGIRVKRNSLIEVLTKNNRKEIVTKLIQPIDTFFNKNFVFTDQTLSNITDSNSLIETNTRFGVLQCRLEQIAINETPLFKDDKIFKVNRPLYQSLSNSDKEKLRIHEVLSFCSDSPVDSRSIRYFINLLYSEQIDGYTDHEIDRILISMGIHAGLKIEDCLLPSYLQIDDQLDL